MAAPHRKLTILDAMILVGATALGIVTAPPGHYLVQLGKKLGLIEPGRLLEPAYFRQVVLGGGTRDESIVTDLINLTLPYLFLGSVTFLVLRVIPPRPPWSELLRQPGLWACGTLTSAFLVALAAVQVLHAPVHPAVFPGSVVVAWSALALSGRWHAEPTWIDRAGRALGLGWIGLLPCFVWWQ